MHTGAARAGDRYAVFERAIPATLCFFRRPQYTETFSPATDQSISSWVRVFIHEISCLVRFESRPSYCLPSWKNTRDIIPRSAGVRVS